MPQLLRWEHSAAADFLYNSMHDISVEVLNLKTVVIFGQRSRPLCKYVKIIKKIIIDLCSVLDYPKPDNWNFPISLPFVFLHLFPSVSQTF